MSDFDWDDDDTDTDDGQGSKALREARAAAKANAKKVKELTEQLNSLQSDVRTRSIADTIKSRGLSEKIAKIVPGDLTTSDEVEAWLNDYADVFGVAPATPATDPQADGPVDPNLEAWKRISATQASGQPATMDEAQMEALIKSAANPEALNKLLFGTTQGPSAF